MNKGLYIHYPFCDKKCNYCDFYSLAVKSGRSEYVDALIREISAFPKIAVDTVYFGGGTPSLMDGVELLRVINAIQRSFELDSNAEITLEANPLSITDMGRLKDFRQAGINRLSIGVQSFVDRELSELGRGHTAEDAINTIRLATESGFDNISVDLMFAIPYQSIESFEKSLDTAIGLGVQHVSVYALSIEEKTVFGVRQKRGDDLLLPDEDTEAEMYFLACKKLVEAGFEHYEISNFARDGKRSRHNMKYWNAEEYIGIGAAAHSYLDGIRYSTPPSVKDFCKSAVKENPYTNTEEDRAEEKVFLALRLKDGLKVDELEKSYRIKRCESFDEEISALVKQGFCRYDGSTLALTEKGFFVSNTIISKILNSFQFTY